jgi:hypothetical protein
VSATGGRMRFSGNNLSIVSSGRFKNDKEMLQLIRSRFQKLIHQAKLGSFCNKKPLYNETALSKT